MLISGNTVCERISEGSGTITTVGDGVGSCVCGCSARDILPPLSRLFRRPRVTISDSNRPGRASTAGFFTPSGVSCPTSTSIRAICAATHTPSCTFASSTVRLSVLVSIDTAIGRVSLEKDEIMSLLYSYGKVLATYLMDDLLSLYTPDGVLMAPGFQSAVGSETLKASYERIFSTIKLEIDFTINEIVVTSDEWAFAQTTAEGTKFWLKKGTQERHHNQEMFIL
ncbi:hypothetical protein BU23DRAFT_160215 [Bimuria novae-zelandiae CBS 107.79]|uniref:SnoaL-like domain-containing protein n=1 Tax=Bimuria novae-zelandiae CBS 107.79 TaxID=1447943 RepID=A0A6A5V772_9PLEO|nr:hypothetical protein BU23DRAFT_160215 [Bimuria novae-zelandiae CBS 107.79]